MYRLCGQKFVSVLYVRCDIESSCFLIETRWSHPACRTIGTSITLIVSGTTTHYTCAGRQAVQCLPSCHVPHSTKYIPYTLSICCADTNMPVSRSWLFHFYFFLKFSFSEKAFLDKLNFIDPFSFSFLLSMYPYFTPVIIFATKSRIVWKVLGMVLKVINFQKQIILFSILPKMNEKLLSILGFQLLGQKFSVRFWEN